MPTPALPTIASGLQNTGSGIATQRQNIVEAIDAIDPRDIPFLARKGWGSEAGTVSAGADSLSKECITQTYTWQNDQLIPVKTELAAAHASGDNVLTVDSGTGAIFRANEVLVVTSLGNTSHFRVTGVNGDSLAVEVIAGDAAHAIDVEVVSLGIPQIEGKQAETTGRWIPVGTDFNYTQIFMDTVAITGTQRSIEFVGISDPYDRETMKTFAQLIIRLETAAIHNHRPSALPAYGAQPASRFGGLDFFIRAIDSTGQVYNASGALLGAAGEAILKDALDGIYGVGAPPDVAMCGVFQRRQINSFLIPFVRTERTEHTAGVVVGQYEYTYGIVDVLLNRYVRPSQLWLLSMDMIGIGPLRGNGADRSFHWEELPKDGDYDRRMVIGEYTMELRNRARAHGLIHNLAVSGG